VRLTDDGGHLVVAVADGVSAGEWSHVAARTSADAAVVSLCDQLLDGRLLAGLQLDWIRLADRVNGALWDAFLACDDPLAQSSAMNPPAEIARRHELITELMSSTLITAVVPTEPDGSGRWLSWFAGLGDTSAWLLKADQTWTPLTAVKGAGEEIATSATAAFPHLDPTAVSPQVVDLATGSALVLMSDGVGDPLGDGTGEVGIQLASWWHAPPPLLEFADQVAFARRSFDDDRTAVGIWVEEY